MKSDLAHVSALLPLIAMSILGVLAFLLVFHAVPASNRDFLIYILGALSGALTVAAGNKVADTLSGFRATVNAFEAGAVKPKEEDPPK